MTRTQTISKTFITLVVTALVATAAMVFATDRAEAFGGSVTATCYSAGYIIVNDGGNVAPAPKFLRLQIAHRTAEGWKWQAYAWRAINGSSFRLNATKGSQYFVHATVATKTATGFTYSRSFVSVTNVKVSPIGAVSVESRTTNGFCQT